MKLSTVLCPIDFSPVSECALELATEICDVFGAKLILHHNLAASSPGFSKSWEWQEVHRADQLGSDAAEQRMLELLNRLPPHLKAEGDICTGPLSVTLLHLVRSAPADLVVVGSHGPSTEDHSSLAERLIEGCPCPILTLHEPQAGAHKPRLLAGVAGEEVPVLVLTDFSESSTAAVTYAFDLARNLPLRLHLVHVSSGPPDHLDEAQRRLEELIPPHLDGRIETHAERGYVGDVVLNLCERLEPEFLVMGEHARPLVRRLFTRDTAREMLHRSHTPVWFVPSWAAHPQCAPLAAGRSAGLREPPFPPLPRFGR
jgi:universal stress protein A